MGTKRWHMALEAGTYAGQSAKQRGLPRQRYTPAKQGGGRREAVREAQKAHRHLHGSGPRGPIVLAIPTLDM